MNGLVMILLLFSDFLLFCPDILYDAFFKQISCPTLVIKYGYPINNNSYLLQTKRSDFCLETSSSKVFGAIPKDKVTYQNLIHSSIHFICPSIHPSIHSIFHSSIHIYSLFIIQLKLVEIPGSHYVHLYNPETQSSLVSLFLLICTIHSDYKLASQL